MISTPRSRPAPENISRVRGSRTAELVAAVRAGHAAHHDRPLYFEDSCALHFAGKWRLAIASRLLFRFVTKVLFAKVMPVATFMLVRARLGDEWILDAVRRGVRQVVFLGAGFDTFALRHPDLGISVFEVDLAASIARKRQRLAAAAIPEPEHLRFVATDFERDALADRLLAAGFEPAQPAFFAWMGVTYYIAAQAVRGTVDQIAAIAAPGSELAFDYGHPRDSLPAKDVALFDRTTAFARRFGEPMISEFDPATVVADLGLDRGWKVLDHLFPAEHPERYPGKRRDLPPVAPLFRLLHLRRT